MIVSTIGCHTPAQRPSSLSGQKPALCKVRVEFSKPVHAVRAWGGPPGTNHGLFKAKPSSHHVHSTLPVTPPTSPCPTLSTDAEPARKRGGVAHRVPTMVFSKPSLAATMCTAPYRTLPVTPPTSPCPTLSADAEPARKRGGVAHRVPTMVFSKPSLAATMCTAPYRWPHPPPPVPPFLLTQNQRASAQRLSFLRSAQCDVTKSVL